MHRPGLFRRHLLLTFTIPPRHLRISHHLLTSTPPSTHILPMNPRMAMLIGTPRSQVTESSRCTSFMSHIPSLSNLLTGHTGPPQVYSHSNTPVTGIKDKYDILLPRHIQKYQTYEGNDALQVVNHTPSHHASGLRTRPRAPSIPPQSALQHLPRRRRFDVDH